VGQDGEGEDGLNLCQAANFDLGHAARRLDSAEHFLDPFAATLADGVAGIAQSASIDGYLASWAGLGQMTVDR
jgi:hypothetical protein